MANRISLELRNIDNIDLGKAVNITYALSIWNEYGDEGEAANILRLKIESDPMFALDLLNEYTPTAIGDFSAKKSSFRKR